jgi:hypothetical protein
MATPVFIPKPITENILLFDGLARCGKMLVAPLVSQFPGIEYAQNVSTLNNLPVFWKLGQMDDRTTATFLRMCAGSCAYERAIGRHLNTRESDVYSVYRSLNSEEILARTDAGEGKDVITQHNVEKRISTFITHHHLPLAAPWFHAFPEVRFLVTVRHPIDVCYSWNTRGWGERWGQDSLAFTTVADLDGKPIPWFGMEFHQEYLDLKPLERIIKCVIALYRMYDEALDELDKLRHSQIKFVCFEHVAVDPVTELTQISDWLDTTLHPEMSTAMERERVPRVLSKDERQKKRHEIEAGVEPYLMKQLLDLSEVYETRWHLDPL